MSVETSQQTRGGVGGSAGLRAGGLEGGKKWKLEKKKKWKRKEQQRLFICVHGPHKRP